MSADNFQISVFITGMQTIPYYGISNAVPIFFDEFSISFIFCINMCGK